MISFPCSSYFLLALLALIALPSLAPAAAPSAPINCFAVTYARATTNTKVDISWTDNSSNEISWQLQYSLNGASYLNLGVATASDSTSTKGKLLKVTWSSAPLNSNIKFRVYATNASSESSNFSNIANLNTDDLGAPMNFTMTIIDPFNASVAWEDGSTSEDGYSIERKIGTDAWQILTPPIQANTLTLGASNLTKPLYSYSFRIRAYKGGAPTTPDAATGSTAVSPYSSIFSFTSAAYTLSASAVAGQTTINLSWPNILNESGYQILILLPGYSQYQQLALVSANITTYQITAPTIEAGKTYSFIVRPYINANTIGESNVASAIVDGISSKTGTSGAPGTPFSHTFTQASSATVTSRSLTSIPSGLTFNSNTGTLSGVYPSLGIYTLTYTVSLSNSITLTQTFYIRVRPLAGPPAIDTVIPGWIASAGSTRNTDLAGAFTDVEAESAVRVSTTLGDMDFILFNAATPATVANFMSYVNAGKYTDVAFHRSLSNFVIQSGGFKGAGTGNNFTSVVTTAPVSNEPGIANYRGTVSMAKLGGNPNSATSQFFISLNNNTGNLDYQNSGFTVFGRVAGNGMSVADNISYLPTSTYGLLLDGSASTTPFENFPINAGTAPTSMDQTKLVKINSITTIPTLYFSITNNSNPSVATASIVNGQLQIIGLTSGLTTITVTATDLDNQTSFQNLTVNITDTFSTWSSRTTFLGDQSGATQNPDNDALTNLQEYAFFGNPNAPSEMQLPASSFTGIEPTARYMTLNFPIRKFTAGLTYVVEANNQLSGTWTQIWSSTDGTNHAQVVSAIDQSDRTVVTIKDTTTQASLTHRFMRVKIVQN